MIQKELNMNMLKSKVILTALMGCFVLAASMRAQDTGVYSVPPPPATKLEMLETNTGTIIIKASGLIGSMSVNGATVTVTCKADTETGTGRKEYGIAIGLVSAQTANVEDRTIVDYDELGPLLDAIDKLAKIDWTGISLTSFSASYQTVDGFRVVAFSARRSGSIEHSVRSSRMSRGIVMTQSQLAEFRALIDQGK
jgi:hypothetical protein